MQPQSETEMSKDFPTHLKTSSDDAKFEENEADLEEEEEEEEYEFSFICGGANTSPIAAEDAFINGQIKPVFPSINRDLLFHDNLPMRPPVKVFVETAEDATSSASENACDWSDRKAVESSASTEVCRKSNSTGFSKIWRFKDLLGRSNSDGRDAFVFLNNAAEVKVGGKGKKVSSAHEVYLKSKAKGEERRRSYLPYRPELMGFFTNVNGGLTKNVHPF
ncbi:hypothetical protein AAHA92_07818 [Salvia divinorum]|uniref:Uncharacterized protein n=1 Tax=Salvia divinorum TaxID=28513 RepID=A0ABD1IA87_SALDI